MVEKEYIKSALNDLGFEFEEGNLEIHGFRGECTSVELKLTRPGKEYEVGFRKSGNAYELVGDWWGIPDVKQDELVKRLQQRYAYHAAKAKLEVQGFTLVSEEVEQGDQIRMVLRRTV
jgi:hypothetical protein